MCVEPASGRQYLIWRHHLIWRHCLIWRHRRIRGALVVPAAGRQPP
jgi:hypothetical protein